MVIAEWFIETNISINKSEEEYEYSSYRYVWSW